MDSEYPFYTETSQQKTINATDLAFKFIPNLLTSQLYSKNCVKNPYFRLQNIFEKTPGVISGIVRKEQPKLFSASPISATEASRHMAILGSCSITLQAELEEETFLLASEAEMHFVGNLETLSTVNFDEPFELTASSHVYSKRKAMAQTTLGYAEKPLFRATIFYQIIPKKAFLKLAPKILSTDIQTTESPYSKFIPLKNITFTASSITAIFEQITPEHCAGHFPNYPVLPIAFLMGIFEYCAGLGLNHFFKRETMSVVKYAKISVHHLVFPGDNLKIEMNLVSLEKDVCSFQCKGIKKDITVILLDVVFQIK